jgi:hypothetical protein
MPAEDIEQRNSATPMVLLWAGAGLAPVAAALLVIGSAGTLLRAGGVLAMLAVILVAVGAILARTSRAGGDVQVYVADEIETLRGDVRADITHAAKATHRVLAEKIMALSDTVEALRGQMEVLRSHVERSHLAAPAHAVPPVDNTGVAAAAAVPGAVYRHTETVQVTTRQTTFDADRGAAGYGERGAGYGTASVPAPRRPDSAERGTYRSEPATYRADPASYQAPYQSDPARLRADPADYQGRARADDDTTGGWSATQATQPTQATPATGYATPASGYATPATGYATPASGYATPAAAPATGYAAGYSAPTAGGFASVPAQGDGADRRDREMHLGERSAHLRMDGSGTEMRVQDRWASVVQRAPEPGGSGGRRRRDEDDSGYWTRVGAEATQPVSHRRREESEGSGGWDAFAGRAALPAVQSGEAAPAWSTGRRGADDLPRREPVDARYRGTEYGRTAPADPYGETTGGRRARHGGDDRR